MPKPSSPRNMLPTPAIKIRMRLSSLRGPSGHVNQAVPDRHLVRLQVGPGTVEPFPGPHVVAAAVPGAMELPPGQRAQVERQDAPAAAVLIGEHPLLHAAEQHGSAVDLD